MQFYKYIWMFGIIAWLTIINPISGIALEVPHVSPSTMVVLPDSRIALLSGTFGSGYLTILSPEGYVLDDIELSGDPTHLTLWEDNTTGEYYLFVGLVNECGPGALVPSGEILKINVSNMDMDSVYLDYGCVRILISQSDHMFVISGNQIAMPNCLTKIDPLNLSVISSAELLSLMSGIAIDEDESEIYISSLESYKYEGTSVDSSAVSVVYVLDYDTLEMIDDFPVGTGPYDMVITGDNAYFSCEGMRLDSWFPQLPTITRKGLVSGEIEFINHGDYGSSGITYVDDYDCLLVNLYSEDCVQPGQGALLWGPSGNIGQYSTSLDHWYDDYDTGVWISDIDVDYVNERVLIVDSANKEIIEIPIDDCNCNDPPMSEFVPEPFCGASPLDVTIYNYSSDWDGEIVSIDADWDGDGETDEHIVGSPLEIYHTFIDAGQNIFILTVVDDDRESMIWTGSVDVLLEE